MLSASLAVLLLAAPYPVPPPQPVQATMPVGCYYFPGHFNALRWRPMAELGEPVPVLGYYRDGEPEVMDWQVRFALEHGLSFFVFDWYYDHRSGRVSEHNLALESGFLHARYAPMMKFALMWCNEGEDGDYTREQMLTLARTMAERYLRRDNYLTADGRPMVWISRPLRWLDRFGVDGCREVVAAMDEVLAARDVKPLFLVANADRRFEELQAAGFAAVSAYNHPQAGMTAGARSAPYASMVTGIRDIWERIKGASPLPYIVPVSPGWDSRPWYADRALVRTGSTPELFRQMCANALAAVDPRLPLVIAECWNEFGEGSYLEPTLRYGFGMLDALREVFCPDAGPHLDLTPQAHGVPVPTFDEIPRLTAEDVAAQGGNLLYNPGAEQRWGWCHYTGEVVERVQDRPNGGDWCLRVPAERGGMKSLWLVKVEPGTTYRVEAWVRCEPGAAVALKAAPFADLTAWLGRYVDLGNSQAQEWTPVGGTWTAAEEEERYLSVEFVPSGGVVYVDDVEVRPD